MPVSASTSLWRWIKFTQAVPLVLVVHDRPEQQHSRGTVTILSSMLSLRIVVKVTNRHVIAANILTLLVPT